MAKARGDNATRDLFAVAHMFPVQAPSALPRALDFNRRVAVAMREAIRECGLSNDQVAARMTELLGYEEGAVTGAQLYAYTAVSRETHTVSLVRFKAFVRATGCVWLWEVILEGEGLTLLEGEEALHAQASLLRKRGQAQIDEADRLASAAPVEIRTRKRSHK